MVKKHLSIFLLLFAAFLFRILLFLQIMHTSPNPDYFSYKEWIYKSYSRGLHSEYIDDHSGILQANQPPLTIYILQGSYEAFLATTRILSHVFHIDPNKNLWINDQLLVFFFRLPSIIADILLGFFIYLFVLPRTSKKIALFASALFLFAPPIFYNSTVWGQTDALNNLFFFLSLFFLVNKKAFLSTLFFGLCLFVKVSNLPVLPFYLLFGFSGIFFSRKQFFFSLLGTLGILWMLCLPFSFNPLWIFQVLSQSSVGISQEISVNAYNFWWLIFSPVPHNGTPDIQKTFLYLTLNVWGYLLFAFCVLPLFITALKMVQTKKLSSETIFLLSLLVLFAAFLFLPKMHERYLYPVLPLLITWSGLVNNYWRATLTLLLIHFLNLYIIWNPNLFLFGIFEKFVIGWQSQILLCLATIGIFGMYYWKYINQEKLFFKKH